MRLYQTSRVRQVVPPKEPRGARRADLQHRACRAVRRSEGGMMRLETLIELKCLDSSFSSLSPYRTQTSDSLSSNSRQLHLSQQHPPPLLGRDPRLAIGEDDIILYDVTLVQVTLYDSIAQYITAQHSTAQYSIVGSTLSTLSIVYYSIVYLVQYSIVHNSLAQYGLVQYSCIHTYMHTYIHTCIHYQYCYYYILLLGCSYY